MKNIKLPNKPSELIKVALHDLALVEKSKKYIVNMGTYCDKVDGGKCEVCFAGAVIAKRSKAEEEHTSPLDFPVATRSKLYALDRLRLGYVESAFNHLGEDLPSEVECFVCIPPYNTGKARFKKSMRALARKLSKAGY